MSHVLAAVALAGTSLEAPATSCCNSTHAVFDAICFQAEATRKVELFGGFYKIEYHSFVLRGAEVCAVLDISGRQKNGAGNIVAFSRNAKSGAARPVGLGQGISFMTDFGSLQPAQSPRATLFITSAEGPTNNTATISGFGAFNGGLLFADIKKIGVGYSTPAVRLQGEAP